MKPKAIKISSGRCSGSVPWQGMLAKAKLEGLMFGLFSFLTRKFKLKRVKNKETREKK